MKSSIFIGLIGDYTTIVGHLAIPGMPAATPDWLRA